MTLACIIHQNTQYFDKKLFTSQLMLDFKKVNFLKIECFLIYFHTAFALRTSRNSPECSRTIAAKFDV